jgi:hypothetical protein
LERKTSLLGFDALPAGGWRFDSLNPRRGNVRCLAQRPRAPIWVEDRSYVEAMATAHLRAIESDDEVSSAAIPPELSGAPVMARLKRRVGRRRVSPSANSNDGDQAVAVAERLLERGLEAVVEAVIDAAAAGDMAAARMVLDRQLPAPRDRLISFELRSIACSEDAIRASADLVIAVAAGQITPAEADAVAKLLHKFVEASTLRDFERRLEALEAAFPQACWRRCEKKRRCAWRRKRKRGGARPKLDQSRCLGARQV